ncbi:putative tannase and feruloyl esterase [Lyophyllum shimeji]|uniref:feruloyl esterase n=1 Tax=Lyophyllum shimeji TaxID=47721 RepID=A0A9P3UX44_LYOSH|nr:putative tannase and feruloyl esterase [Lyophyllum shimeji]
MARLLSYILPSAFWSLVAHGSLLGADPATTCTSLKTRLHLENTTILSTTHVVAPVNVSTPKGCFPEALVSSPICRVQFVVNTTSTSAVFAEAWLPDTWYGRFLAVGNGGLGGCVDYQNIDYGTSLHFATCWADLAPQRQVR